MSAGTVDQRVPRSAWDSPASRGLGRVTGLAGLATLLLVFIPGIAGSGEEPGFTGTAEQIGAYFRSVDTTMGAVGSFASTLGVIAFLWFALGLSSLLRAAEATPPWRSTVAAGSAAVFVAVALGGGWTAATVRAASLDPDVGRYAFDLGNASFANGWVALGSFAICSGFAIISTRLLARWLGWWAIIAGAGLALSRAVWTSEVWLLPYALFWLWFIVVCVTLLDPVRTLRERQRGESQEPRQEPRAQTVFRNWPLTEFDSVGLRADTVRRGPVALSHRARPAQ